MNYETFKSSTLTSIQKHFGEDVRVSLHSVMKNNNIQLDGLTIQPPSSNISPTIYLNYYYEDYLNGKPFPTILDNIITAYEENLPKEDMDFSFFTEYEKVKYHIIYKLIHYEKNSELLKDVPHFRFLDLAVVFCCLLPESSKGNATILIHNHHLSFWNMNPDSLYELAVKNTPSLLPCELKSMEEVLKSFGINMPYTELRETGENEELPEMYVLSNSSKFYGAACILYPDILADFAKNLESDLYILPSSIHEVLLIPKNEHTKISHLNQIIQDVNATQVLDEEILSDHAYTFERSSGLITL